MAAPVSAPEFDLKDALVFAELVRFYLYPMAFCIIVFAITLLGVRTKSDPSALMMGLLKIGIIVILMVFLPPYFNTAAELVNKESLKMADESLEGATLNSQVDALITGLGTQENTEEASGAGGGSGWIDKITNGVTSYFGTILTTIGQWAVNILIYLSRLFRGIIRAVQQILLLLMVAVSPILFAFGTLNETQHLFISFLLNTLSLILWGIGFVLADLMIYAGIKWMVAFAAVSLGLAGTGAAGAAYVVGGPISLSVSIALCACALGLVISLNLLGPLIITALLNGKSPAGAAMQSAQMGMQAANALANISKGLTTPVDRDHMKGGATALSSATSGVKGMAMGAGAGIGAAMGMGASPGIFKTGGFSAVRSAASSGFDKGATSKSKESSKEAKNNGDSGGSGKSGDKTATPATPPKSGDREAAGLGKDVPPPTTAGSSGGAGAPSSSSRAGVVDSTSASSTPSDKSAPAGASKPTSSGASFGESKTPPSAGVTGSQVQSPPVNAFIPGSEGKASAKGSEGDSGKDKSSSDTGFSDSPSGESKTSPSAGVTGSPQSAPVNAFTPAAGGQTSDKTSESGSTKEKAGKSKSKSDGKEGKSSESSKGSSSSAGLNTTASEKAVEKLKASPLSGIENMGVPAGENASYTDPADNPIFNVGSIGDMSTEEIHKYKGENN